MSKPKTLRFGIQSLDRLIGSARDGQGVGYGIDLSPAELADSKLVGKEVEQISSSICLAGPDGTGKSVFSLHLASQYLADCLESSGDAESVSHRPKVIYISTDLTYSIALRVWNRFDLRRPFARKEPIFEAKDDRQEHLGKMVRINLEKYFPSETPNEKNSLIDYLQGTKKKSPKDPGDRNLIVDEVCYVDLATRTAGDDWGFVHRLLSMLEEPSGDSPRHLVVLDAVEGFETLVGDLNAFGERSSRRSRIAQVMRLAAGKAHLLLVVEEKREERFPEEFVTDVVMRLRNVETGRYLRRTVEIEKARGQLHVRGQHPYVIRDGGGSTTGDQINADDPKISRDQDDSGNEGQPTAEHLGTDNDKKKQQAYVHVFLSPDNTSREIMAHQYKQREATASDRYAAFGVPYLDNMLGGSGQRARRCKDDDSDTRGLVCGSATALLGDSLTQKSQLGEAFLSRAFHAYAEDLTHEISKQAKSEAISKLVEIIEKAIPEIVNDKTSAQEITKQVIDEICRQEKEIFSRVDERSVAYKPVTVMFTTRDVNNAELAEKFYQWLQDEDVSTNRNDKIGKALSDAFEKALALQRTRKVAGPPDELAAHVEGAIAWFVARFKSSGEYPDFESFKEQTGYREGRNRFTDILGQQILKRKLRAYIKDRTICRRFEIHDIPSAVLLHIFQRNIEKAQRQMWGIPDDAKLPDAAERFRESWRIRVVIDDLNSFRNIFPEIRADPLMLPSLLFMLGREGVTSLIIDSQSSGSPELSITERFDSSVRDLVQTRIYTWRLPFYGENRVAISLIPPFSHEYRGLIRELRWESKDKNGPDRALTVDPHFELYMGLERGQPQPVPLEVRLYADTLNVEKYIATEEKLFREIFTPVVKDNEASRVIHPMELNEYEALRDACHLQRDTRLDHTTILQVNEFWWLRRPRQRRAGAFRTQSNYLSAVTATLNKEYCSESVVDSFLVFQPAPSQLPSSTPETSSEKPQAPQEYRRRDFFDERCGYHLLGIKEGEKTYVDRVPYTWDFGFMLCNGRAWEEAFHLRIGAHKFQANDFASLIGFIARLRQTGDKLSAYIKQQLSPALVEALSKRLTEVDQVFLQSFLEEFNQLLKDPHLYDAERFRHVQLSLETRELLREREKNSDPKNAPKRFDPTYLNRTLLEDAYPDEIFKRTVKGVWDKLRKATDRSGPGTDAKEQAATKEQELPRNQSGTVSWREFLAASKVVAEFQSYRTSTPATAFDFTMLIPESFSCLILEMWLSEAYETLRSYENKNRAKPETEKRLKKTKQVLKGIGRRRWQDTRLMTLLDYLHDEKGKSLETILAERRNEQDVNCFSIELYKTWLLLTEAINFTELVDNSSHLNFEFKSRDVNSQAVSARHWYKTASKFVDSLRPEQLEDNWVPLRLPGHFSVRADWFLAVAGGSRSSRLADHALDLLSSRRSNVTRLQEGIGLPTRRLFDTDNEVSHLRTRLICAPEKGKPLHNVEYEEFRKIGASKDFGDSNDEDFHWLWRSRIASYNRHSRIWHKWLNRSLLWWHSWRQRYGSEWTSGFKVYDLLSDVEFGDEPVAEKASDHFEKLDLESWKHFHEMRDILIAELEQAIISTA